MKTPTILLYLLPAVIAAASVTDKFADERARRPLDGWAIRVVRNRPLIDETGWVDSEAELLKGFVANKSADTTPATNYVAMLSSRAAAGDEDSQLTLGAMHWLAEDYAPAVKWLTAAGGQGALEAQFMLGFAHLWGIGATTNRTTGIGWFEKAAEQEMPEAQHALAQVYLESFGEARDTAKGQLWLKRAARNGHVKALEMLGIYYRMGMYVPQSDELAEKCLLKAVARGAQTACAELGLLYAENGRGDKAVRWLRKGANAGRADVCHALGRLYYNGSGVKKDYFQAFKWWFLGSERGDPNSQKELAHLYEEGKGVEQNKALAAKWRKAARGEM